MHPKGYDPKTCEEKWQRFWIDEKIYAFDPFSKKPVFAVDTPPPTVSGRMHLGHAFSYSQMDFIVRYHRMKGENVFCPFGTDDNGLATEALIEKMNNVVSRNMDRHKFIELCLSTLNKIRPSFVQDWKKIGLSADWNIFYSTIDDHCRRISQKSFIDLYNMGRIYRKKAPFIWCPKCQTAIAQVEMRDLEVESKLVYIRIDTSIGKPITIATTRPEMMGACVGIYVHPSDKRYKEFVGAFATLPIYGRSVEIKTNEEVDMNFGSGAVYHCTFGDVSDAEWTQKLNTEIIEILNKDGTMNKNAGKYEGMTTIQARENIIRDLKDRIEKIETIKHTVNVHERCGTPLEILTTEQWFIRYLDLKDKFLKAGRKLRWYPKHMISRYENWIKGLKWDWCISRQRYFGVPFPVWYCKKCKSVILADEEQLPVDPMKSRPKKRCKCGSDEFEPEKDVLDTWATSSLTPQIVSEMFKDKPVKLFPMTLRPQAHDIITFWLFNTLVKSQLHYKKNPWRDVMISGWALDPKGKKMSKSKGNVIEPDYILNKYSADALRFWAASSKLGEDLNFQERIFIAGTKMMNKLWNVSLFVVMNVQDYNQEKPKKLKTIDKWILTKITRIIKKCTDAFDEYEYSKAKKEVETFFWHTFADNYLEIVKDRIYNPNKYQRDEITSAKYVLYNVLLSTIKLFAPIMPHITEEVYQMYFRKFEKEKSIHIAPWPKPYGIYKKDEAIGDKAIEIISCIRKYKTENNLPMNHPIKKVIIDERQEDLKSVLEDIKAVMKIGKISFEKIKDGTKTESGIGIEIKE